MTRRYYTREDVVARAIDQGLSGLLGYLDVRQQRQLAQERDTRDYNLRERQVKAQEQEAQARQQERQFKLGAAAMAAPWRQQEAMAQAPNAQTILGDLVRPTPSVLEQPTEAPRPSFADRWSACWDRTSTPPGRTRSSGRSHSRSCFWCSSGSTGPPARWSRA
jgi:hypothetical protein